MQPGLRNAALAWTAVGAGGWRSWQEATKECCQAEQAAEWGPQGAGPGRAQVVSGPPCGRHHSNVPLPLHPKLTAAPPSITRSLPPPDSTIQAPTHMYLCVHTSPCPAAAVSISICHLTQKRWAGTLGPVQSNLVLSAKGKWSRGQDPRQAPSWSGWSVTQDCTGSPKTRMGRPLCLGHPRVREKTPRGQRWG